jgi:hypothetical protein
MNSALKKYDGWCSMGSIHVPLDGYIMKGSHEERGNKYVGYIKGGKFITTDHYFGLHSVDG